MSNEYAKSSSSGLENNVKLIYFREVIVILI